MGGLALPRGTTLNFSKARIIQKWRESALCAAVPAWQVGTGAFARCPLCGLFMGGGSWNQGHVCIESQLHPAPQARHLPGGRVLFLTQAEGPCGLAGVLLLALISEIQAMESNRLAE